MMMNKLLFGDSTKLIKSIDDGSIDFICTDLPYGISRKSGYTQNSPDKKDYIAKYGGHKIDFGDWDTKDIDLDELAKEYFRVLRPGGVVVIFYDIWGATDIKNSFKKFKQPRILEWIKTNPVPINSKLNFLSNAKEYMFTFVKKSKPTYNSEYNVGSFKYPIVHGKVRTEHTTQKPVALIEDLINIYTNEGMNVLDTTAGSMTTAIACINTKRDYICMEQNPAYFKMGEARVNNFLETGKDEYSKQDWNQDEVVEIEIQKEYILTEKEPDKSPDIDTLSDNFWDD